MVVAVSPVKFGRKTPAIIVSANNAMLKIKKVYWFIRNLYAQW